MVGLFVQDFDFFTEEPLNAHEVAGFGFIAKRVGKAVLSCTSRASDAVNVDFRFVGQIEIEHMRHVVHVDATAGDIGGDKNEDVAVTKRFKRSGSCGLALVSVNGIG